MSTQPTYVIGGEVSNRVTRMLDIPLAIPASSALDEEIKRYPETRRLELERLSAELERKYLVAEQQHKSRLQDEESKLRSAKAKSNGAKGHLQNNIRQARENIEVMQDEIVRYTAQIKNDSRAIGWMITWRIFWGILCTAGILIVGVFLLVGFILKVIGFFMPDSKDDD